jgi:hypothetical protein
MENVTNFFSSLFEKERSGMLIKTKPGDKEIIELGDTLLRPKSKQKYSEKDMDKVAELGYN